MRRDIVKNKQQKKTLKIGTCIKIDKKNMAITKQNLLCTRDKFSTQ
jgi:hypothetical protein